MHFIEAIRFEDESQSLNGINALALTPTGSHLFATSATVNRLADVLDPNLANNQVTSVTEVPFLNIIKVTYDNTGKNLHNPHVTKNGAIIGGSVSGDIENQGLISDVHILPEAILNGGKLSKNLGSLVICVVCHLLMTK